MSLKHVDKKNVEFDCDLIKLSHLGLCSSAKLKKIIKSQFKEMKKIYRCVCEKIEKNNIEEWLTDNFYILEEEAKGILKSLRKNKKLSCKDDKNTPYIYDLSYEYFVKTGIRDLTQENIVKMLKSVNSKIYLSVEELNFLPTAIKAALISSVHFSLTQKDIETATYIISMAIKNLKNMDSIDFNNVIENVSPIQEIFMKDPAHIYHKMDDETKSYYRYLLSVIAKRKNMNEKDLANQILNMAIEKQQHIGEYILNNDEIISPRRRNGKIFVAINIFLPLILSIIVGIAFKNILIILLVYFPIWEIMRPINEYVFLKIDKIDILPKMDINNEVPKEGKTLIVISTILPKADQARKLKARLENLYFSNGTGQVNFCILADFAQHKFPESANDKSQVDASARIIRYLNNKYGNRFFLFVRKRVYSKTQKSYIGWERKRGAITELVRFIKGKETSIFVFEGEKDKIKDTKYMIALDSDTELLMDSTQKFVSAALHPLNKPVIDNNKNMVVSGHAIFTPRIGIDLKSASSTLFSRIMAGCGGTTMYDILTKDLYQDFFGESIFSGKGLIDIDVFYNVLDNKFSDDNVLSHDILEGIYLRAGFVSDIEITDGYPSNINSWLSRLHRWIRGDWQNINYIFNKNFNYINKYKLFDNIRRSFTPVLSLICILLGILFGCIGVKYAVLICSIGFLSVTFGSILASIMSIFSGGWFTLSRKFYTQIIPQAFEYIFQAVFSIIMLVSHAIVCIDAIIRTLYRKYISRNNLLEWTTAAQAESKKVDLTETIKKFLFAELIGIFILLFSPLGYFKIYGFLFSCIIPISLISGLKQKSYERKFPIKYKDTLISYVADMWKFYEENYTETDNYLPPDNIQLSPVKVIAHRTSPTNIGFLMISTLSARDFDFIDSDTLYTRINNTLLTVEKLKKWNGNLYNWYDNETLEVIDNFISAVDSGNFVSCLVAVKEGLKDYYFEKKDISDLVVRIQNLIDETDLSKFYCKKRNLFSIGYDSKTDKFVDSYYDFLMSEARLMSYFAIAKRQVPKKHWGSLNRTLSRNGFYAGPVSWTGTMFEFFMPHLLLPASSGSLLDEALRYCVYCQRKRISSDMPWGISESAFYAFDNNLYYQYKAHGVQKLGVKQNLNKELVISPYSTFLTIPFAPQMAMKNLFKMEKMGFKGMYGFYEAIDFTKSRVGDMEIIKSYMAHHIGMSIIAATNAIFDNRMQKRFMRDKNMRATRELLEEKIARDAVVFDNIVKSVPKKSNKIINLVNEYREFSPDNARVIIFKNADLTSILTDNGSGYMMMGNRCLTRKSFDLLRKAQGIYVFVYSDKLSFSATPAPFYDNDVTYQTKFDCNSVSYFSKKSFLQIGMICYMHKTISCEQRQIIVKNNSAYKKSVNIMVYLEPILAQFESYISHPAFSKLFVSSYYDKGANVVVFTRRLREGESPVYLAVGFLEDIEFELETKKENLIESSKIKESLLSFWKKDFQKSDGLPDCICALKTKFDLSAGSQREYTVLITGSESYLGAISNIIESRNEGIFNNKNSVKSKMFGNAIEDKISAILLPKLLYNRDVTDASLQAMKKNNRNIDALWSLSISGDLPIVILEINGMGDSERIEIYIKTLKKLRICGVPFDLVFIYREIKGENILKQFIETAINKLDAELLIGNKGGIFLINLTEIEEDRIVILKSVASYIVPDNLSVSIVESKQYKPITINNVKSVNCDFSVGYKVYGGVFIDDRFYIDKKSNLPYNHVLSNKTFGTLLSNNNLGFTWASNSRENKLTPWYNDIATDNDGEMMIIKYNSKYYNLLSGALCSFSPLNAVYEGHIENIEYRLTVWVPETGNYKYCKLDIKNKSMSDIEFEVAYFIEPVLGVDRRNSSKIYSEFDNGMLILRNFMTKYNIGLTVRGDYIKIYGVNNRLKFFSGEWDKGYDVNSNDICGSLITGNTIKKDSSLFLEYRLEFAKDKKSLGRILSDERTKKAKLPNSNIIKVSTPDESLNYMINTWIPHQIISGRIWSRTGFYQCGGAYGFRDQLQDAWSYLLLNSEITKQQIIRACAVQFVEGDVLHWWHNIGNGEGGVRGVRTKYSDDLLWLPLVTADYVKRTGDKNILEMEVPYIEGDILKEKEFEKYFIPEKSSKKDTVYKHCLKAIEKSLKFGAHNLPLIGCGDWSDGYNKVGIEGKGESVWLGMFLIIILNKFSYICELQGDVEVSNEFGNVANELKKNIDESCWDGSWYIRAFYDNGSTMGSNNSQECKIDSLTQSFSVFADMPDKNRISMALNSSVKYLVDENNMIIKLFSPAFVNSDKNPGYVKSYPAGIRENGGQYTHAGLWLAMALIEFKNIDLGYNLLKMLNPAYRSQQRVIAEKYKIEPYYMAGDIYSNSSILGHGGWSIYTGSAGWYYKVVIESLLGIDVLDGYIEINPNIPSQWPGYEADIDIEGTELKLKVIREAKMKKNTIKIPLDGEKHEINCYI